MMKKDIMVGHTLLPPDEEQVPSSCMAWCPKLTRYKMMAGLTVLVIAVLVFVSTVTRARSTRAGTTNMSPLSPGCSLLFHGHDSNDDKENDEAGVSSDLDIGKSEQNVGTQNNQDENETSTNSEAASHNKHMKKRFPSAIVIGARKAGTRAVLRFINLHPDVVTSKQEPHFFDRYYKEGLDWYRQQMPYSFEGQMTMEKTPNYFVDWDVPEKVYNFNSSIKLILIVRNPIDRAISDYVQLKEKFLKNGHSGYFGSFEELAFDGLTGEVNRGYAPIKRSLYCRHLDKWLSYFHMSQLLIVDGENMKVKPWEEMYKIEEFLGLSHQVGPDRFVYNKTKGFYCVKLDKGGKMTRDKKRDLDITPLSERCLADSKGRDHPFLAPIVRQRLSDFFKPFNKRFFTRIGRTFDWT